MLSSRQLRPYFTDLQSPYFSSAIALVHSRLLDEHLPDVEPGAALPADRAQRRDQHHPRQPALDGDARGGAAPGVRRAHAEGGLGPIIQPGMSDSASFDNALEFFLRGGMSLPHALAMLVPESFNEKNPLSKKAEELSTNTTRSSWPRGTAPRPIIFSDGRYAGGMLDRNGLRPARYLITRDGLMVIASETGVLEIPAGEIESKGTAGAGQDRPGRHRAGADPVRRGDQAPAGLRNTPTTSGCTTTGFILRHITSGRTRDARGGALRRARCGPSATTGRRSTASSGRWPRLRQVLLVSMGDDTPLAVSVAEQPQRFFNFFRQQFAQVTNPPMDSIREELVMSLTSYIGAVRKNILKPSAGAVQGGDDVLADHLGPRPGHPAPPGIQGLPDDHAADALSGRGRRRGARRRRSATLCRAAEKAVDERLQLCDPQRPRRSTPRMPPSRRCWPCRPCTTT